MVALLSVSSERREKDRRLDAHIRSEKKPNWKSCPDTMQRKYRVNVLERPSTQTALVDWSDPQGGHYAQQNWRSAIARTKGVCAVCGDPIYPGQPVYKPSGKPGPANADAMISAFIVNRLPVIDK